MADSSSDFELSDYGGADDPLFGAKAIAAMQANVAVDRVESKKNIDSPQDAANAPNTATSPK
ncbi:hypothetical protein LTR84_012510 [Exophiala bonariae]|uniref:Uncharacterized protein n=1 Tax=Exophiala bonariae TaxID=1690606 RepID=A0AAV9NE85_9EURO|nr:hypothetical protein LTR84_012510 [Exophiala bonariae]